LRLPPALFLIVVCSPGFGRTVGEAASGAQQVGVVGAQHRLGVRVEQVERVTIDAGGLAAI